MLEKNVNIQVMKHILDPEKRERLLSAKINNEARKVNRKK